MSTLSFGTTRTSEHHLSVKVVNLLSYVEGDKLGPYVNVHDGFFFSEDRETPIPETNNEERMKFLPVVIDFECIVLT